MQELIRQGAYCKVHISHLKSVYGKGSQRGQLIFLAISGKPNKDGVELSADVYPYNASYTGIGIVFPKWAKTQLRF